ncbi:MAG: thiamine phosphate synthase [Chitinophagales bacterium]
MLISKFQYLTQDLPDVSHKELTEVACKNGIRWVQLRVKNKPFDEWLRIAREVKQVCDCYEATLIINDNVEIAKTIDVHGVHLGKQDMSIWEARAMLGATKIIGGTANTSEDVLRLLEQGADYIGLGPYKVTDTKKNLAPVLGLKGYAEILELMPVGVTIPVIAIGGIQSEDVSPLLQTGVYGVAVSSAINLSNDKEKTITSFLHLL